MRAVCGSFLRTTCCRLRVFAGADRLRDTSLLHFLLLANVAEMLLSASVGPAQQAVKHVAALALLGARNPSLQRAFAAYSGVCRTLD